MINQWISIPLAILGVMIVSGYIVMREDNDYQEKLKNPSWPPTCKADIEAKINELIEASKNEEWKKIYKQHDEMLKKTFTELHNKLSQRIYDLECQMKKEKNVD